MDVVREVGGCTLISVGRARGVLGRHGLGRHIVRQRLSHQHVLQASLVTLAYVAVQGFLFVAKFIA